MVTLPKSNVPTPNDKKNNVVPYPQSGMSHVSAVTKPPTGISTTSTRVPTPGNVPAARTTSSNTTPSIPTSRVPTPPQQSSYRQELDNLLNQYRQLASTPVNYNPQTDPRYQAYRQLAQQQAGVASRNAMETMNERGILNSSLTSNQLGQIQQQAEQQALSAIPQFYEQAYSQRQNELNNLGNLINMYAGRDDTMFNRGVTEAGLTGQYIPPQAQPIIDQLLALKSEGDIAGQSPEYYANLKAQADTLRDQLSRLGIDPSFIGSNVTGGQARQAIPNVFATIDARNTQFNQGVTMAELTGRLPDGTPTTAQQQLDLENAWYTIQQIGYVPANLESIVGVPAGTRTQEAMQQAIQNQLEGQRLAISQSAENRLSDNTRYSQFMDAWRATGTAPYDYNLNGTMIRAGTPYYDPVAERQSGQPQGRAPIDAKASADNYNLLRGDIDQASNYQEALSLVQANRDFLSDSDYRKLLDLVDETWR